MYRHQQRLNEKGYTLLESIVQLVIFVMLIHMMVLFLYWRAPAESFYANSASAEWELFSIELQGMLERVKSFTVTQNCEIVFVNDRGKITAQFHENKIRKLVDGAGHVPLLMNVKSCSYRQTGNELYLKIEYTNKTVQEGTFAIGLYEE